MYKTTSNNGDTHQNLRNYYSVTARAGHVGKGKYILIELPIVAETAKEAALIARMAGRVKHHNKRAIENVRTISYLEYCDICSQNSRNPYFRAKNAQEQRLNCCAESLLDQVLLLETDNSLTREPMEQRKNKQRKYRNRYCDNLSVDEELYDFLSETPNVKFVA